MTYTCAVFPTEDATLEEAQDAKYDLVARKLDLQPGQRLLDVGCGWGGMVRHAAREYGVHALGVTLSPRAGRVGAADRSRRRGSTTSPRCGHWTTAHVEETDFDAISSIGLTEHIGVKNYPAYFGFIRDRLRPQGRLLNHCITRPDNRLAGDRRVHRPLRLPRRRADRLRHGSSPRSQNAGLEVQHEENLRVHYAKTLAGWCHNLERELGRLRRRGRRGHRAGLGPLHGRLADRLRAQRDPAPPRARHQDRRERRERLPAAADTAVAEPDRRSLVAE